MELPYMGKLMPVRALLEKVALEKALVFEEHAYRYYSSMLGNTIMSDSFDLLKRVLGHKLHTIIILKEMQRKIRAGDIERIVQTDSESEPPTDANLDAPCGGRPGLDRDDRPHAVLMNALRQEQRACVFYRAMASHVRHGGIYNLFQTLFREAKELAGDIEGKLSKGTL
jgi:hypothetical protein